MPDVWITDMTHFLDDGRIALQTPLVSFLGEIVERVTAGAAGEVGTSAVGCRRRPARRPCSGTIAAVIDAPSQAIHWGCDRCSDRGVISNWQGTPWDRSAPPRDGTVQPAEPAKAVWTPAAERAWQRVPPRVRLAILNGVYCATCHTGTSIAIRSATVRSGDLILRGTCVKCGGNVGRLIEEVGRG